MSRRGTRFQSVVRGPVSPDRHLAEGWERQSRKDYVRFLSTGRGSLYDIKTQLLIAQRVLYTPTAGLKPTFDAIEPLRRPLQALISALQS